MTDKKYVRVRNILICVLVLNWAVALAKILYGHITNSLSMFADGLHSLSDGSSNIIGLIGIFIASRPKDVDHPYGHRKYETLISMAIAMILFFIAFNIIKRSIVRFIHPEFTRVDPLSFIVMFVTLFINVAVMKYEYTKGKELKSDFLIADSYHTGSDIFASISVIASLISIKMGFPIADVIAGFIISLLICYVGVDILKHSSRVLCDYAVIDVKEVEEAISDMPGVIGCHRVRTRGRLDDIYVDLHITVDKDMPIKKAHELSTSVEKRIRNKFSGVTDVIVHIEPS
ncbi:MAG: cation transporter [Omnitrophica WOR_2 bacterium SM23_29]|nr:MAG: cation transporter [Omnitrophica WOR_2 bacterium SM23_29]